MEKLIAELNCSLNITCPNCDEDIDLLESPYDDDGIYSGPLFSNNWKDLEGAEVECDKCEHVFEIEKTEY